MNDIVVKKAKSYTDIKKMKFKTFPFEGEWKESFGEPEMNGCWFVYGLSGQGKTNLLMQLAKYLTNFGKVFYNTLEEGPRQSFKTALERNNMQGLGTAFSFESDKFPVLKARLEKKRSPNIIIIDSWQYLGATLADYEKLRAAFPKKLFIINSHASGSKPKGSIAESIMYDADIKIHVRDFAADIISRFGGGKQYIIWEKGYRDNIAKLTNN